MQDNWHYSKLPKAFDFTQRDWLPWRSNMYLSVAPGLLAGGCGDVDDEKQVQWHTPSVPLINSHPILPQMQYSKQGPSSRANLLQWPLQLPPKKAWRWADFLQKFCIKIPIRITSLFQKGYLLSFKQRTLLPPVCQGYIWSRGCWWKLGFFRFGGEF